MAALLVPPSPTPPDAHSSPLKQNSMQNVACDEARRGLARRRHFTWQRVGEGDHKVRSRNSTLWRVIYNYQQRTHPYREGNFATFITFLVFFKLLWLVIPASTRWRLYDTYWPRDLWFSFHPEPQGAMNLYSMILCTTLFTDCWCCRSSFLAKVILGGLPLLS